MNVNGIGSSNPLTNIQSTPATTATPATAPATRPSIADRLELSGVSHLAQTLKASGDVRTEKVANIKAQIENGSYDADGKKLDASLDPLLSDLNS